MPKPTRTTCTKHRNAYEGVEAVIVSNLPNERGMVTAVLRDGNWKFPRLRRGDSALPRVQMPRVRSTR
jgi:hypothetical protein